MWMRRRGARLAMALWFVLLPAWLAAQPPAEAPPAGIVEEDIGEDIEALLAEAEEVSLSGDPASIPLFERIIQLLERRQEEGTFDEQAAGWMKLSLFRRAEARINLLDEAGATADLTALVRFDPAWEVPEGYSVSRLFSKLLEKVRARETGVLDLLVEPPDATVYLDGEPVAERPGPRRVLAGDRLLRLERPGYDAIEQPLAVPPSETVSLPLTLERTSAVVRVSTRPAGVEVVLNGQVLGVSQPREGAAGEETSAVLASGGLEPGSQLLTFRKPGYRPVEMRLEVVEAIDYALETVSLEPSRGTVTIAPLPDGGRLLIDGAAWPVDGPRTEVRLDLPPGAHEVRVDAGAAGLFERRFDLADRQLLEIEVEVRPSLMMLGVLGDDRVAATDLETDLAERLGALARWAFVDRAEEAFDLLRGSGVDSDLLRGLAAGAASSAAPDWAGLQENLDRDLVGSAYLLAVLSDDLVATSADLWLWSAAPGPTRPARRRVSLADGGGLEELAEALDRPLRLTAPWVGARFVDSPAADRPLVLSVEPGGPAAAAGLAAGDAVGAVDGQPVTGSRQLVDRLAGLAAGSQVALRLAGAGREITLTLGSSPLVAALDDPSALDPALAARLASLELAGDGGAPAWLVRLNRGVILMRSGEWRSAAEALRGIEAPETAGVGQATVDYLLALALLEVDRSAYADTAHGLIGRAADGGGRLEHNDGPLLEPRARARLETLVRE